MSGFTPPFTSTRLPSRLWRTSPRPATARVHRAVEFKEIAQTWQRRPLNPDEFEKAMREFLANQGIDPDDLAKAGGMGLSGSELSKLFAQLAASAGDSKEVVEWEIAKKRAIEIVHRDQTPTGRSNVSEVEKAFEIASLWLSETSEISAILTPKLLSRELWVADAIPLFRELADPVAAAIGQALGENLGEMLPDELSQFAETAGQMLRRAGAGLFAIQLGEALGRFAREALAAGEIGVPISERPGIVLPNATIFAEEHGLPQDQFLIFLWLRELALGSLFYQSSWLRDHIVRQVREYASELRIDTEQLQEFAEKATSVTGQELAESLATSEIVADRTPEQVESLERIEFMLALIEGWVDKTARAAGTRLPALPQIAEAVLRRRATGGIGEKTFGTLLGLELRPKLMRESASLWEHATKQVGRSVADQLWSHPDLLPSRQELNDPSLLISRLRGSDDDMDRQLRDLLG